jgi:hypothetical protein
MKQKYDDADAQDAGDFADGNNLDDIKAKVQHAVAHCDSRDALQRAYEILNMHAAGTTTMSDRPKNKQEKLLWAFAEEAKGYCSIASSPADVLKGYRFEKARRPDLTVADYCGIRNDSD